MSDTTEMVRLIRHAAALLRSAVDAEKAFTGGTIEEQRRRSNTVAAAAVGHATLGLVAACMQPESEPNAQALARVRALIGEGPYVRTDELLEALDGTP